MSAEKMVIIGGVAGGASCAARARRLSEEAQITVLERGPYVSFANCGLPYHIGGEIPDRDKLILRTPEALENLYKLDVRVRTEAVAIDREKKAVKVRQVDNGREESLPYDKLVISTGAEPMKPPIPGIDREGLFTLRNIPDTDRIIAWIEEKKAQNAVVVGGGYIGLEMAEQLERRGLKVSVAEALPQIMGPLDPEMSRLLQREMETNGIDFHLSDGVDCFDEPQEGAKAATVVLKSGTRLPADLVILGMGVKPEHGLAREAGLEIGQLGGIRVDDHMKTSDNDIYAIGDAVEVRDGVTREWTLVPLAGPANRQGRIVADNVYGEEAVYKGTWGTAGIRLYSLVGACTGANEKRLEKLGWKYEAVHLHPGNHVGYYPGATPIAMKLLFSPENGRLFGAQAVGKEGAERRIDVIAAAIMAGMTVEDLAQVELCYAPPFGAAKDPVNLAGMAAENVNHGLSDVVHWDEVDQLDWDQNVILDVREEAELAQGRLPHSLHIPLGQLRDRLGELPRDKRIVAHCASGQRSYNAICVLRQHGFDAANLSGSIKTWSPMQEEDPSSAGTPG